MDDEIETSHRSVPRDVPRSAVVAFFRPKSHRALYEVYSQDDSLLRKQERARVSPVSPMDPIVDLTPASRVALPRSERSDAELQRLTDEHDELKQRVTALEQALQVQRLTDQHDELKQRVTVLEQALQQQQGGSTQPVQARREAERVRREQRVALLTQDMSEETAAVVLESSMVAPPSPKATPLAVAKLPPPGQLPSPPRHPKKAAPLQPPPEAPPPAAPPPALPRDLTPFVGKWGIVHEDGKAAYISALGMSFVVTKAAKACATPPVRWSLDAKGTTLESAQGPVLGKMIASRHPPEVTTTVEKSSQLGTQHITSQWEDEGGCAVLYCRTTTVGKADVCEQRTRVLEEGGRKRLVVETHLTKTPGAPTVVYTRTYEPLLK